ncbi:hypothetical protein [Mycobacterium sp. URHD0025]|uniref:hypothetical protein n=1 Tax=Mycobacterium sp. URHD0025 TaxID=1298864 RepID=UPI0004062989|nr:hypothetical protein [Mycobacterium sp. URHD0025]
MSAIANPGPVLIDDISDISALMGGTIEKPPGEYAPTMTGPGAWPEFDESVFDQRKEMLSSIKSAVSQARASWDAVHAGIFNGLLVWVGGSATAAAAKAQEHSKAMQEIEQQLADAIEWCGKAWVTTRMAKKAISDYVELKHKEIYDFLAKAEKEGTKAQDAKDAAQKIAEQAYHANKKFLDTLADSLGGKTEAAESPPPGNNVAGPLENNGTGTPGSTSPGSTASVGGTSGSGKEPLASLMSNEPKGHPQPGDDAPAGGAPAKAAEGLGEQAQPAPRAPSAGDEGGASAKAAEGLGEQAQPAPRAPSAGDEGEAPAKTAEGVAEQAQPAPATLPTVSPNPAQPPAGKPPTSPVTPSVPSAPGAPSAPSLGGAPSSSSAASSPLSSGSSSLAGAGMDPSKAAEALAGRPPVDPLKEFSKGFADSAGTPVHAASSGGGAPPPLAPAPAVPASDPMVPASTNTAPVSQNSAPAAAPPAQPPSGGPMGMGGGGMPLGPPPTAPPAGAVAPPPPPAAPPAPAVSAAAGAQVAPIPVSAARAERDAALNAAKRSGSDPLETARRIAAALNVGVGELKFTWLTGLTQDGTIVVANNYGLGYIPQGVKLPQQVKFASVDESIPMEERAKWTTYPILALHGWAQAHDTTLRAVIGFEEQFKGSDPGVPTVALQREDLPSDGRMQGRSRLEVIAPEVAARLSAVTDAMLIDMLPPAPADPQPPEDRRFELMMEVFRPLLSADTGRAVPQLQALIPFANHMQEMALHGAYTAVDGEALRTATADAIYWQHIGVMAGDALATVSVAV